MRRRQAIVPMAPSKPRLWSFQGMHPILLHSTMLSCMHAASSKRAHRGSVWVLGLHKTLPHPKGSMPSSAAAPPVKLAVHGKCSLVICSRPWRCT